MAQFAITQSVARRGYLFSSLIVLPAELADEVPHLRVPVVEHPLHVVGDLVGIGGAIGAVCRYVVDVAVPESIVPPGTLSVNTLGSFVLAFVPYLNPGGDVLLLVGTGACGSFPTFSSFSVAIVGLWEQGSRRLSVAYAAANLIGALAAVGLAWVVSELATT